MKIKFEWQPASLDELADISRHLTRDIDRYCQAKQVDINIARNGGICHAAHLLDEDDWTVALLFGVTDASRPHQHGITGILAINRDESRQVLFGRGGSIRFNPPEDKSVFGQFRDKIPADLIREHTSITAALREATIDGLHTKVTITKEIIERLIK